MYFRNNTDDHVNFVRYNTHHDNSNYDNNHGNYNDYPGNYKSYNYN